MAGGDVQFRVFTRSNKKITAPVKVDVPASSIKECCYQLTALADLGSDDVYKNDKFSLLEKYDINYYTEVKIHIEKDIAGVWTEQVEVIDQSYGEYFPLASFQDSENTVNYVGLIVDWKLVLTAFGEGIYRFVFEEIGVTNSESIFPFSFCLKQYTFNRANNTTRFTYYHSGYVGDNTIDTDVWDYTKLVEQLGSDWVGQIRLGGYFGDNKSGYEREYVKYSNGQQVYIKDEQIESYTWFSSYYPAQLHNYIKTQVIQADRIEATDYNKNNPNIITDKAIKPNANYEPKWTRERLHAPVEMDFVQEFQNRRKKRC